MTMAYSKNQNHELRSKSNKSAFHNKMWSIKDHFDTRIDVRPINLQTAMTGHSLRLF